MVLEVATGGCLLEAQGRRSGVGQSNTALRTPKPLASALLEAVTEGTSRVAVRRSREGRPERSRTFHQVQGRIVEKNVYF